MLRHFIAALLSCAVLCRAAAGVADPGAARSSATGGASPGLFAGFQVAQWPFERNWAHLPAPPDHLFVEVGANNYGVDVVDLAAVLDDGVGGFVVTFEPLAQQYGALLARGREPRREFYHLGLAHDRGIVLPFAVERCKLGSTLRFHVSEWDGCSSTREVDAAFQDSWKDAEVAWMDFHPAHCANMMQQRTVPCVSLEEVVGDWLGGREIARLKIDTQGADMDVFRSLGPYVGRVLMVQVEVVHSGAAVLYRGAPRCREIVAGMHALGFRVADNRLDRGPCNTTTDEFGRIVQQRSVEFDMHFVRRDLRPLWHDFFASYLSYPIAWHVRICQHYIAAGACGGPFCNSPEFGIHVNRTGGCEGRLTDLISFDNSSLGLLALFVAPGCVDRVRVWRSAGRLLGQVLGPGTLRLQIHQGSISEGSPCAVRMTSQMRPQGFLFRALVGLAPHAVRMGLLLPGLAALPTRRALAAVGDYLDVAGASPMTHVLWPGPCCAPRSSAEAGLLRWLRRSEFPLLRDGGPMVSMGSGAASGVCLGRRL